MAKTEFLDELEQSVRATAEAALQGTPWSSEKCPYLEYWLRYYRARDSHQIERAIRRYAPNAAGVATAGEYIPLITQRVRRAIAVWSTTGEITEVPEGVPLRVPGADPDQLRREFPMPDGIFFKAREDGPRPPADAEGVRTRLGPGAPLDSGVRARMGRAFEADFSAVRVHTDAGAAALAARMNARAFTIGQAVAFAAGEYRPGTVVGDALIAHELAHVVQQERASAAPAGAPSTDPGYGALEADADRSAAGVMAALWGGARGAAAGLPGRIRSGLRSGVRVQRCKRGGTPASPTVDRITIVDSPAGAIGGYPDIVGDADLNAPGPFNNATTGEVKNVHQIHFHLDAGDSASLTPSRRVTRTVVTAGGATIFSSPGFDDGPPPHEIQRPSTDNIVIADAPGVNTLSPSNYPFVFDTDFQLTVAAGGLDVARIKYLVKINKVSAADIPNTENRITATEKKDLVRSRDLP
jgi:hypothetical protein